MLDARRSNQRRTFLFSVLLSLLNSVCTAYGYSQQPRFVFLLWQWAVRACPWANVRCNNNAPTGYSSNQQPRSLSLPTKVFRQRHPEDAIVLCSVLQLLFQQQGVHRTPCTAYGFLVALRSEFDRPRPRREPISFLCASNNF